MPGPRLATAVHPIGVENVGCSLLDRVEGRRNGAGQVGARHTEVTLGGVEVASERYQLIVGEV
jgi:hypothetical protein